MGLTTKLNGSGNYPNHERGKRTTELNAAPAVRCSAWFGGDWNMPAL